MCFLSVVLQIILESLPVSSSGHAIMLGHVLPNYIDRLAGGATAIMLIVYFCKDIVGVCRGLSVHYERVASLLLLIVVANSVTVFVYTLLKPVSVIFPLWVGFLVTALSLLSLVWCQDSQSRPITYVSMFLLGLVQGCASLPGISRLASTYVAASWFGFSPAIAFRISCALQLPLFCVGFLEGFVTAWRTGTLWAFNPLWLLPIIGAMVIAYFLLWAVELLMRAGKLWYIGLYMLLPTFIAFMRSM